MTEWITRSERHVPEEELHAYFDQALSRSQCAEIETHLSHCATCQAQRAEVALLRDRTTAVLARLSPRPVIVPPPFQTLLDRRSRQLRFAVWRVRFERAGLWAAGIAAATGIGWVARSVLDPYGRLAPWRPSPRCSHRLLPLPRCWPLPRRIPGGPLSIRPNRPRFRRPSPRRAEVVAGPVDLPRHRPRPTSSPRRWWILVSLLPSPPRSDPIRSSPATFSIEFGGSFSGTTR